MQWKIVPVVPTPEICLTAEAELDADSNWPTIWAAMLDSAPKPRGGAVLTEGDVFADNGIMSANCELIQLQMQDLMRVVRPIEAAVLRKLGINAPSMEG